MSVIVESPVSGRIPAVYGGTVQFLRGMSTL
jgi:hypothetical protein